MEAIAPQPGGGGGERNGANARAGGERGAGKHVEWETDEASALTSSQWGKMTCSEQARVQTGG